MKTIFLQTTNSFKFKEYQEFFSKYGIQIIQVSSYEEEYFQKEDFFCFLKEETVLNDYFTNQQIETYINLQRVYTYTKLDYSFIYGEIQHICSSKVNGFLDLTKRNNIDVVFGWDDIFIFEKIGLTVLECREKCISKNNSRQEILSTFCEEYIYYKNRIDLNFNKQNNEETISFNDSVIKFVKNNKYLSSPSVKESGLYSLFISALYNGCFFRSSKNRREKNYWIPGLNAGLPLVPKKDEIHEITFSVHDFSHFAIPDLVLTNTESKNKKVYVIHRMLSEAMTMVFADMLFVDCLKKDNVDYDFSSRKIYPVFQKFFENREVNLKQILLANSEYCIFGNKDLYEEYVDKNTLKEFTDKFEPFFVEDYKWTEHNLNNLEKNVDLLIELSNNKNRVMPNEGIYSTEEIIKLLEIYSEDPRRIFEKIFEWLFKEFDNKMNLKFINEENFIDYKQKMISSSFKKYMLGQSFIFEKFSFLSLSKRYKEIILNALDKDIFSLTEIKNIREFYNQYLLSLKDYNLINIDDYNTYKEVYPIFESFFVFYDKEKDYYPSLKEISTNILERL